MKNPIPYKVKNERNNHEYLGEISLKGIEKKIGVYKLA